MQADDAIAGGDSPSSRARSVRGVPLWRRRLQSCWDGVRGPVWYAQRLMYRVGRLSGSTTTVEGIVVYHDLEDDNQLEAALLKLKDALALIRQRDARRWARFLRDGPSIVLGRYFGGPFYASFANAIDLDVRQVLALLPQLLAVTIVHEATHARIACTRKRLRLRRMNIAREERVCVEEGIAFMRRVARADDPRLEPWIAKQRKMLDDPWWTTRKLRIRRLRGAEEDGLLSPWMVRAAKVFWRL